VLFPFGGGLSLAAAISDTGLAQWIGASMSVFDAWPELILVSLVVTVIVFLTELTSNTATTAAFLPVLAALALSLGEKPAAVRQRQADHPADGAGRIPAQHRRHRLVTALTYTVVLGLFGVDMEVVPDWVRG